jgi:hypothetical protein
MPDRDHPAPARLERFARGHATEEERQAIARHLLAGCPKCTEVLYPFWQTADRLARRRATEPEMARRRQGGRARV